MACGIAALLLLVLALFLPIVSGSGAKFLVQEALVIAALGCGMFYAGLRGVAHESERMRGDMDSRHLAAIVESSEDSIVGMDRDGIITSWNQGAVRISAITPEEAIGQSFIELVTPERHDAELDILQRVVRGERVEAYRTIRITRKGLPINASVSVSPIKDGSGAIVGVSRITRDITNILGYESEISRISSLYAALSHINQAIIRRPERNEFFDEVCRVLVQEAGFGMAWIGWHEPETHRIVPLAVAGQQSNYAYKIEVYTDDRPMSRGPVGTAFREVRPCIVDDFEKEPATFPWSAQLKAHNLRACAAFPICIGGTPRGILAVYAQEPGFFKDKEIALLREAADDISFALENQVRDEERAASDARYRRLFEHAPSGIVIGNTEMYYVDANPAMCALFGYTREELIGMHASQMISDADKAHLTPAVNAVKAGIRYPHDWLFRRKDGSLFPGQVTSTVMPDGNLMTIVRDITEQKKAEADLRELNENLEHKVAERTSQLHTAMVRAEGADRLKSAFLAMMSHELRTPLNSILGFTGILLQGIAGPVTGEQTKQLGMVRSSARHLLELINDVLDISRIEAGQLPVRAERFSLRGCLEHVINLVKASAEKKGLSITLATASSLEEMVSDRRRVEQILLNLLNNAVKFTEQGGVTLTAERATDSRNRPSVRLCVADTGIGIKPEDFPLLFEPFRQVETGLSRSHEGTGLGLAICRRLATLLGGEILVRSEWTKGSEFIVTLPLEISTPA
jgi:PAS domain S-box-containing protein